MKRIFPRCWAATKPSDIPCTNLALVTFRVCWRIWQINQRRQPNMTGAVPSAGDRGILRRIHHPDDGVREGDSGQVILG